MKPCKEWHIYHINWCRISEPSTVWEKLEDTSNKNVTLLPAHKTLRITPLYTWPWHGFLLQALCGQIGNHFSPKVSKAQRKWLDNHLDLGLFDASKKWTKHIIPDVGEKNGDESQSVKKHHQIKHIQVEIDWRIHKNLGKFHDVFPKIRKKQIQDHQLPNCQAS